MAATVLIAEDEAILRTGFSRILSRRGFHVETASDGEEALRVIDDVPVDVLVSDLQMPGMGGLQLLEEVRRAHSHIPVIVISGAATLRRRGRGDQARCLRLPPKARRVGAARAHGGARPQPGGAPPAHGGARARPRSRR
ncbi:MAG: response regulator [Sandaracinaceae bacterium]|nr:response regulator [Sandaracinaceae bacterium]